MAWILGGVALPDDAILVEFDDTPIEQSVEWSLTGAVVIQESRKLAGRKFTLDLSGIARSTLRALETLTMTPAVRGVLHHPNGTEWEVIFARPDPISATAYVDYATVDLDTNDLYEVKINLIRTDGWL